MTFVHPPPEKKVWIGDIIKYDSACACSFAVYLLNQMEGPTFINNFPLGANFLYDLFALKSSLQEQLFTMSTQRYLQPMSANFFFVVFFCCRLRVIFGKS